MDVCVSQIVRLERMAEDSTARQTHALRAEAHASVQRSLRLAAQSQQVAQNTLHKLNQQTEQLDRTHNAQKQVEQNLNAADQVVKSIESLRGAAAAHIRSWFRKEDTLKKTTSEGEKGDTAPNKTIPQDPSSCAAAACSSSLAQEGETEQTRLEEHLQYNSPDLASGEELDAATDESLDAISNIMKGLKLQAEAMNAEMKAQSSTLEAMSSQADKNSQHMQRTNLRTKALR